jgi:formate dehydrogenase accessory protein FdhE
MPRGAEQETEGSVDEIVVRLEALIGEPHVSEAYVRFRLDLLRAQRDVRRRLEEGGVPAAPCPLLTARPPLRPGDVPFPAALLDALLHALQGAAAVHGQATEDLRRLGAAAAADPAMLPALAETAAFGADPDGMDSLARRLGIYVDALLFVGRVLAAPCVAAAVAVRTGDPAGNPKEVEPHRCGACGSAPSVARLRRADGRRILTCGLCGSEWETARLACACCGTREGVHLGVLRLTDADARWVETCEACKGYIKTVDERRLPEGERVFPVVEEAATLHLDLLAEREGYIRRVPYVLCG